MNFVPNFKETIRYNIPGGRQKTVVLFLAECIQQLKTNDGKIENYFWLSPEEAKTTLPEWYRPVIEKSEYSLRVDF